MATLGNLIVRVQGDIRDIDKKLTRLETQMKGVEKSTKKFGETIGNTWKKFVGYAAAITAGIYAVSRMTKFVRDSVQAYAEEEAALTRMEAALKAVGKYSPELVDSIQDWAHEMQVATGFQDDMIYSAEAILATFTQISTDLFPEVIERAMDVSRVFGTDMNQSIVQLSKAINDPRLAEGLRRIGISISAEQTKLIDYFLSINDVASAQRVILDELKYEIGGVARAYGETWAGKQERLNAALSDFKSVIGSLFVEALSPLQTWALKFLENEENLMGIWRAIKLVIAAFKVGTSAFVLFTKYMFSGVTQVIAIFRDFEKVASIVFNPWYWVRPKEMAKALGEIQYQTLDFYKNVIDDWKNLGKGAMEDVDRIFKTGMNDIIKGAKSAGAAGIAPLVDNVDDLKDKGVEMDMTYDNALDMMAHNFQFVNNILKGDFAKNLTDMGFRLDQTKLSLDNFNFSMDSQFNTIGKLSGKYAAIESSMQRYRERTEENVEVTYTFKDALAKLGEEFITHFNMMDFMAGAVMDSWTGAVDAFATGAKTVKEAAKDMVASFLQMLAKKFLVLGTMYLLPPIPQPGKAAKYFGLSALSYAGAAIVRSFQEGGIAMKETLATVGERGPEAVLPLNKETFGMLGESIVTAIKESSKGKGETQAFAGGGTINLTIPISFLGDKQVLYEKVNYGLENKLITVPKRAMRQ